MAGSVDRVAPASRLSLHSLHSAGTRLTVAVVLAYPERHALALHFHQIGRFRVTRARLGVRRLRQLAKPRKPQR